MAIKELSFVALFTPLFMQGSNLGEKVSRGFKGVKLLYNTETGQISAWRDGKYSAIGAANIASYDFTAVPEDVTKYLGLGVEAPSASNEGTTLPPARGRPPSETVIDPNDDNAHRAAVRAASANSNVATTHRALIDDSLIQASRNAAMGIKSAQVSDPRKPAQGASVVGKPKAIGHQELRVQLAKEAKDPVQA